MLLGSDRKIVYLCPGHGGRDPGAIGPDGTPEKKQVLWLALIMRMELERYGYYVQLTRWNDEYRSHKSRVVLANSDKADIYVSLHFNGWITPQAHGAEVLHFRGSTEGQRLAQCLQDEMVHGLRFRNRGVKERTFYVLRHTRMPAVIVEPLFITNPEEERWIRDTQNVVELSRHLCRGIAQYFGDVGR